MFVCELRLVIACCVHDNVLCCRYHSEGAIDVSDVPRNVSSDASKAAAVRKTESSEMPKPAPRTGEL